MLSQQQIRQAAASAAARAVGRGSKDDPLVYDNPTDFIEREMFIPELRAPMPLNDERGRVLRVMASRENGAFKYQTWLFSMPKKSAKTTIGAGVALWQAWRVPHGEIYVIGNDLKQADNRMAQAIRFAIDHNPQMRDRVKVTASKYTMKLDNGTRIETIPVDPRGEAGMNPTGLFWTEAWGAKGKASELLWSEATLSPTRQGDSFKFVESYAGYNEESLILERLYNAIVKEGVPHPDIPELYTNGQSIGYWCTRRYLPWQQDEAYYRQQALEKTPDEFNRQHNNQWASPSEAFVPIEWWDACGKTPYEDVQRGEGVILAADAGVISDCFAVTLTTRRGEKVQVQYARKWQPHGVPLDYRPIEAEIRRLINSYNILECCYDNYQLHDMMTRIRADEAVNVRPFNQGAPRAIADKRLYDMIRDQRIQHRNEPDLRDHIANANRKPDDDNKLRLVKRNDNAKIDLAVTLSMGTDRTFAYAMD